MGRSEGSFIVEAYPVVVRGWDLVVIFLTVLATSALVVWYPVRRQINKL
jgi:lipoprotein-releasing system permease protein